MLRPRWIFRSILQVLFFCGLTTILLMFALNNDIRKQSINKGILARAKINELNKPNIINGFKLRELQRTMFLKPNRPNDKVYNINVTLSEKIPLERSIPDTRAEECKKITYNIFAMPSTSVVVIFYNEALSMLLRTVHSILNRTPKILLKEIILVDDHSSNADLKEYLGEYLKFLPKVKLLRTKKREGLIRARLLGFSEAKGEFVFFQDSHTEANTHWLEPLLDEILINPKTVIQPVVDQIDAQTIEYRSANYEVPRGGFSWDLRYTWMEIPNHEKRRLVGESKRLKRPINTLAFRAAALVGCAFGVLKRFFIHIGTFDDDMRIWGGENIELAWRTWQCHGRVLTHPCSRVAHTFKPFGYKFDGDREKIVQKNLLRMAETWMDDYAKYFYASTYTWVSKRTFLDKTDRQSLQKRKDIRKELKCKSFDWYMRNIIPEMMPPSDTSLYHGEIFNIKSEACWYLLPSGYIGITYYCFFHRILPANEITMDASRKIYIDGKRIRIDKNLLLLYITSTENDDDDDDDDTNNNIEDEIWSMQHTGYYTGLIQVEFLTKEHVRKVFCVAQITNVHKIHYGKQMVQATDCNKNNQFQHWRWTYKFDWSYKFDQDHAQPERTLRK